MQTLPLDPGEEARAATLMESDCQRQAGRWHVRRTRTAGTSARHAMGHPSEAGKAGYSRTFRSRTAAQREADAWNGAGDFAEHGPAGWTAEVIPGLAPSERAVREINASVQREA